MKKSKIIGLTLLVILVLYLALQIVPYGKEHKKSIFAKEDEVLVIAHGGGKELNPENTWMAFDYAVSLGSDVLEIDVQLTKDGELACVHNMEIADYCDKEGKVNDFTLKELEAMNFGYHFKDLNGNTPYKDVDIKDYGRQLAPANIKEMFEKYGNRVGYIIELKDEGELAKKAAVRLKELIDAYDLQDYVCIASFTNEVMNEIRSTVDENYITSFDMSAATSFIIGNYAGYGLFLDYPHSGFQIPMSEYGVPLANSYLTYKIHKNDMFVHYWTINTKEDMRKCIEAGADGIITDRMDLLLEVLKEYQ